MQPIESNHAPHNCLRFTFDNDVLFFNIAAGATMADVACAIRTLPGDRYGEPVAIDVTFGAAPPTAGNINQATTHVT